MNDPNQDRLSEVDAVRRRIETWRQTREKPSPMPEALWSEAARLANEYGVCRIARELRLGYAGLKQRVEGLAAHSRATASGTSATSTTRFLELMGSEWLATALPAARSQMNPAFPDPRTVLELQRPDGVHLTLRLAGSAAVDMAELVASFLG
jgi:hypothetical protein